MVQFRETFSVNYTNAAQIAAAAYVVVEDQKNAKKNNNLPHNAMVISNQNTSCTLFLFMDNFIDQAKPDYVLFPSQQITVPIEDGVAFTQLFIKNTHAATVVAANEIKVRLSTLKLIKEA